MLIKLTPEPVIWCTPLGPAPPAVVVEVKPLPIMAIVRLGGPEVGVTDIEAARTLAFGAGFEEPAACSVLREPIAKNTMIASAKPADASPNTLGFSDTSFSHRAIHLVIL